ncbi:hypothetical protein D9757_009603 [Collybiopsis confluens]|uniref:Uncharacterized protein n=1 Tax=Collybiopsis confluens TaxID=2823264 RepID=A0A8H5H460_9AGAR|nr:hypothetical protein D9757_009603 [Collybiopsis confluens]
MLREEICRVRERVGSAGSYGTGAWDETSEGCWAGDGICESRRGRRQQGGGTTGGTSQIQVQQAHAHAPPPRQQPPVPPQNIARGVLVGGGKRLIHQRLDRDSDKDRVEDRHLVLDFRWMMGRRASLLRL